MSQTAFDPFPRAILFDLDDTLCDYASARESRLRIAFDLDASGRSTGRQSIDLDRMISDSIGMQAHGTEHFQELFRRHGRSDPAEVRAARDWFRENRFHGLRLFPETLAVLKRVRTITTATAKRAPRRLGIITNGPTEVQGAKVELLGIGDLVDFVLISEEFGLSKPHPEIFKAALRMSGVDNDQAIFVGDAPEFDMAGARAAGISSVWVNRGGLPWEGSIEPPEREIRSIGGLPGLVGS